MIWTPSPLRERLIRPTRHAQRGWIMTPGFGPLSWRSASLPSAFYPVAGCHSAGTFVFAGVNASNNLQIPRSTDYGASWTYASSLPPLIPATNVIGIAGNAAGDRYVMFHDGSSSPQFFYTSINADSWAQTSDSIFTMWASGSSYGVNFAANGTFYWWGGVNQVFFSTTGLAWFRQASSNASPGVKFASGATEVIGLQNAVTAAVLRYSGGSWGSGGATAHTQRDLAYGNGTYVVAMLNNATGNVYTSTSADGVAWATPVLVVSAAFAAPKVVFDGARFLLFVNNSNTVRESANGSSWAPIAALGFSSPSTLRIATDGAGHVVVMNSASTEVRYWG